VDQALLRVLPVRAPQELVIVEGSRIDSYPFYKGFRDRNRVFSGLFAAGFAGKSAVRPEGAPEVELSDISYVSGNFFEALGVGAARGRVLTPADDEKPGGGPVIVLSYRYWERRMQADPAVVGRKFVVNGYPLEIAGVAEKGFGGLLVGDTVDAFVPITMTPVLDRGRAEVWTSPSMFWLFVMGRLNPGVSMAQAQAALRVLTPQVYEAVGARAAAESSDGKRPKWKLDPVVLTPGAQGMPMRRKQMADPLRILMLAAGFVLLIACANVAKLLLARAAGRGREIAVRLALGAGRGRILRQLLTESLVLAALGAVLGVALAFWGVKALAKAASWGAEMQLEPDLRLGLFALAATIATTLLFGLAPAIRATRVGVAEAMKQSGNATAGRSRHGLGRILVAAQVALSLALIAGAGLFLQTLRNLRSVESGFERENVMVVDVDPTSLGYEDTRLRSFYDQFVERVRASSECEPRACA
jgi:predicted permease